jgi:hypothetical protein
MDPVRELKIRADLLQARLASGDADALVRLRALPEMRRADDRALSAMAKTLQRKHCLAVVARQCGFSSWSHACRVLTGDPGETDFGTLLYNDGAGAFLNHWFTIYDEARAVLDAETQRGGPRPYLLAFRRHLFVATSDFVGTLGLDPQDSDWQAIGWDWAHPKDRSARGRLYQKRLTVLRRAAAEVLE